MLYPCCTVDGKILKPCRLTSSCSEIQVPREAVPSGHDGMSPVVTWWSDGRRGGVHISKTQTNEHEYYPITDTNLGNGCGHNFLFLIIRFAPVWIKHLHGNQYILVLYCILCVLKLKLRYNLTLNPTGEQRVT